MLLEPNAEKGYRVPGLEELIDEGFLFLVAGSDTTAYSLACATYYILTHREVLQSLQAELRQDMQRTALSPDWKYISQLPYLVNLFLTTSLLLLIRPNQTAVIKESLRLSSGIPGILPRVVPPQGAQLGSHYIPGGVG